MKKILPFLVVLLLLLCLPLVAGAGLPGPELQVSCSTVFSPVEIKITTSPWTPVNFDIYKGGKSIYNFWNVSETGILEESIDPTNLDGPGNYTASVYFEYSNYDPETGLYTDLHSDATTVSFSIAAGQLKAPQIEVLNETELLTGAPLKVRFKPEASQNINPYYAVVKYTVTRDSDGGDMSVMPKGARERTVSLGTYYTITDGLAAGKYTITAQILDTNKWYKDSPKATKTVTVTGKVNPEFKLDKKTYRIGDKVTGIITAPGHSSAEVQYYVGSSDTLKTETFPLINGTARITSGPLADGNLRTMTLQSLDGKPCFIELEYRATLPNPTLKLDKDIYCVGDTAKITASGEGAKSFEVYLWAEYDATEAGRALLNRITYAASGGKLNLELPFTEAGSIAVEIMSLDETLNLRSEDRIEAKVQVLPASDQPLNLPAPSIKIQPKGSSLQISWSAVSGAQSYTLRRSIGGKAFVTVAENLTGTSCIDSGVPANTVVLYQVMAVAENRSGTYTSISDVKSYMLLSRAKKPTAKSKTAKTMNLSWKKVKNATSYEIYYSTSRKAPTLTTKAKKSTTALKLTVKKLKGGKTYYVYVRAVRKLDDGTKAVSAWSKAAKVKIKKK